jgi:putative component of toxin-antitoxin plasmid stabilization module
MKKIFYILTLFILTGFAAKAQDDGADDRIRDKMREYIQKRMDLTKNEAEKFTPVFIRYFREWRTTLRDNKGGDRLNLQQKIIELKIKYRPEFKEILGEKRSTEVYKHQDIFIKELDNVRRERIKERINNRPQRTQKVNPA